MIPSSPQFHKYPHRALRETPQSCWPRRHSTEAVVSTLGSELWSHMAPHELLRLGRDGRKKFILLAGAKNDVFTSLTKSRQPIKCSSENSCQGYIGRWPKRKKKIRSWRSRTASPRHKPNTTAKSFPGDLEGSGAMHRSTASPLAKAAAFHAWEVLFHPEGKKRTITPILPLPTLFFLWTSVLPEQIHVPCSQRAHTGLCSGMSFSIRTEDVSIVGIFHQPLWSTPSRSPQV